VRDSNDSFDAKMRGKTIARSGVIYYRYYYDAFRLTELLEQTASSAGCSLLLL